MGNVSKSKTGIENIERCNVRSDPSLDESDLGVAMNAESGKKIAIWLIQKARSHGLKVDILSAHDLDGNLFCLGDSNCNLDANACGVCGLMTQQYNDRSKAGRGSDTLADGMTASLFAIAGIFIHDRDAGIEKLLHLADTIRESLDDAPSVGGKRRNVSNDKDVDATEDGEWRINDD